MNLFDKFSLSKEIVMKEGEIILDQQRVMIFPLNIISIYELKIKDNPQKLRELYESTKSSMIKFSKPLGKEYALSYKDFLDRWVKYTTFGGWGIAEYRLIEESADYGYLYIKNSALHSDLKARGIKEAFDVFFAGVIAGSLSGTFKMEVDVIETKCICSGNDVCVYYWGPKEFLRNKFPEIVAQRFGGDSK